MNDWKEAAEMNKPMGRLELCTQEKISILRFKSVLLTV